MVNPIITLELISFYPFADSTESEKKKEQILLQDRAFLTAV